LADTGIEPYAPHIIYCVGVISTEQAEEPVVNGPIPESARTRDGKVYVRATPVIHLDQIGVARWELASKALKSYEATRELDIDFDTVSRRTKIFRGGGLLELFSGKELMVLNFAGAAHGGPLCPFQ
jgi:hypothetical protein